MSDGYIPYTALRSVRPGKLRGLTDDQIEDRLVALFGCDVEYSDGVARIYCVDAYESPEKLLQHAKSRLGRVGRVSFACQGSRPFVKLEFNEVALRVIGSGSTNALDIEE